MYEKYVAANGNQLYRRMLADVLNNGWFVSPRGMRTQELQTITHILEPMQRVLTVPGRAANPFFNVAENLAIIGAWPDQRKWLGAFNKNYLQFFDKDSDQQTWAFYGDRLRKWPSAFWRSGEDGPELEVIDQLSEITDKLNKDWATRQAVASLWHPRLDNMEGHKDYPCNFAVKFYVREFTTEVGGGEIPQRRLNMTVFNRSNDIHWGLFAVNLSQWSFIQEVVAKTLALPVGHQIHISDSLHLYFDEPHQKITENMAYYKGNFDIYAFTKPRPMFSDTLLMMSWGALDRLLRQWKTLFMENVFDAKDLSYKSSPVFENWPFLEDAWHICQAYLMRKDRLAALHCLTHVIDDAQWLACTEWMLRGQGDEQQIEVVNEEIRKRFAEPVHNGIVGVVHMDGTLATVRSEIMSYLFSANLIGVSSA